MNKGELLDYLRRHLEAYGNTVLGSDISEKRARELIRILNETGMPCTLQERYDGIEGGFSGLKPRKKAGKRWWLIEMK